MKKIILAIALLCGLIAGAQTGPGPVGGNYTLINSNGYNWGWGYFRSLGLPTGAGSPQLLPKQFTGSGAIFVDSVAKKTYIYYSPDWVEVGSGSGSLNDSVYARNDSLYYNHSTTEFFTGIVFQAIEWTNPLPGDHNIIGPDGKTIVNQRPTTQSCDNSGNIQLSYISNLDFAVPAGVPYSIQCQQYFTTNQILTFDVGTGGTGEFRIDLVYAQADGLHIRKGNNTTDVNEFPQLADATELFVAYIRINESQTVPADVSVVTVYNSNAATGEFSHTSTNFTGLVFNYTTNTYNTAPDSSIHFTGWTNPGNMYFISPTSLNRNVQGKLSLWLYNKAVLNSNRNIVIRLYDGVAQVAGSSAITLTAQGGYSKTLLNTWQNYVIDFSAFGGQYSFDRINIRGTGTGGSPDIVIDKIEIQKGINVGGGGIDPLAVYQVYIRNDSVFYKTAAGSEVFAHKQLNIYNSDGSITTGTRTLTIPSSGALVFQSSGSLSGFSLSQNSSQLKHVTNNLSTNTYQGIFSDAGAMHFFRKRNQNLDPVGVTIEAYSDSLLIYKDSIVSGVSNKLPLDLRLKQLQDGSSYDKVLAYNSTTGQVGYSTGGGGGTTDSAFILKAKYSTTVTGTSYNLANTDNGHVIEFTNSSNVTVTVPSLSAGFNCIIKQMGTGQVILSPDVGVTIHNRQGFTRTYDQFSMVTILRDVTTDEFTTQGDMQ